MNRYTGCLAAGLWLVAFHPGTLCAQVTGTITRDRVNVRGQPTVFSEIVTQLKKGETVTVLKQVKLDRVKPGELAEWAQIQMPANTPVWVHAGFIDPAAQTVKVRLGGYA
jgi:uncharacterized protein YgiM (DUF1202 family)